MEGQHPIRLLSTDSASPLNHMEEEGRVCLEPKGKMPPESRSPTPHLQPCALQRWWGQLQLPTYSAVTWALAWPVGNGGGGRGWEWDASIPSNLPEPLLGPRWVPQLCRPTIHLTPSRLRQNPLTQAPASPVALAACPASLPPPPRDSQDPHTVPSAPLDAARRFRAGNGKSPASANWPVLLSSEWGPSGCPALGCNVRQEGKAATVPRAGGGWRVKKEGSVQRMSRLLTGRSMGGHMLGQGAATGGGQSCPARSWPPPTSSRRQLLSSAGHLMQTCRVIFLLYSLLQAVTVPCVSSVIAHPAASSSPALLPPQLPLHL